jgi:hypothetical protein
VLSLQSLVKYVNSRFEPFAQAAVVRRDATPQDDWIRRHAVFLWLSLFRWPLPVLFWVHKHATSSISNALHPKQTLHQSHPHHLTGH